jgi:hypothetical protein
MALVRIFGAVTAVAGTAVTAGTTVAGARVATVLGARFATAVATAVAPGEATATGEVTGAVSAEDGMMLQASARVKAQAIAMSHTFALCGSTCVIAVRERSIFACLSTQSWALALTRPTMGKVCGAESVIG